MASRSSIVGIGLVVLATILLAFRSILVKLAYAESVSVVDLLFYRFLFTIPLLWAFAWYTKGSDVWHKLKHKAVLAGCIAAGFFGYYFATLLDFFSLTHLPANINRLIVYTFPIYVLLIHAGIHRTRPKIKDVLIFLSVQIGLFVVLGASPHRILDLPWQGIMYALGAAISYAIYIVINQQVGKKIGSILFTTYALSFSLIFNSFHYVIDGEFNSLFNFSAKAIGIMGVLAILCTFLPLLLVSEGIARIGAPRFSLINASGPVITIGLAYVLLGETMTLVQLLAGLSIVGIIGFAEYKKLKES